MKRKLLFFIASILALSIIVSTPLQSSAATKLAGEIETQSSSKFIYQTMYYQGIIGFPPKTIYYSKNGWTGTLNLKTTRYKDNLTISEYSGTIFCSGTCVLPTSINETE